MRHRTTRRLLTAALAVALGALSACSGSGEVASDSSAGGAARVAAPGLADGRADSVREPARATVRTQSVIRTGDLAITGNDVGSLRAQVIDLLRSVGGLLEKEDTSNDRHGRVVESTLVLRIPVEQFDVAKQSLEKLGKLTYSHESATDVTTQVIDVNERVQTLQNSLDRLQRFQRTATDVADLLRYENQITRRQSELRSTQAQQSYLQSRTTLSTITVHLSTPDKPVAEPGALDHAGFVSGLRGGSSAVKDIIVVAVTVAGALLPFLAVLAVLGWPTWLVARALIRRRHTSSPAEPTAFLES